MANIPTPHNAAKKEDIADTVIMPGDPLRSEWMAKTYLKEPRLVNNIRGVQGYTGTWKGQPVTIMSSGIGIPSISLYTYELFNFYDVKRVIRTGTAGSICDDLNIGELIIADKAYTNSCFFSQMNVPEESLLADPDGKPIGAKAGKEGINALARAAKENSYTYRTGAVLTEEIYYSQEQDIIEKWAKRGVLAFEMEAAALFANAAQAGKQAAAVFTVSNSILTGEEMEPKLRETSLDAMVKTALDSVFY